MESCSCMGLMAVVAVSGSVAIIALRAHNSLVSEFMKMVQSELGGGERNRPKKKVSFAADVVEPSSNNKEYRKRQMRDPNKPSRAMDDVSMSLE